MAKLQNTHYLCTGGHFSMYFLVSSVKHSNSHILAYLLSGFKVEIDYKGNTSRTSNMNSQIVTYHGLDTSNFINIYNDLYYFLKPDFI